MGFSLGMVGAIGHPGLVLGELHQYPQVRLVGVAPSYEGEDVARFESLGATVYPSWGSLLAADAPDILVVCARHDQTATIAIAGAQAGCHLISEKPAAQSLDQLAILSTLVADRNLLYASILPTRYGPAFFTAHQLVRQGLIGEPYLITAQKSYRWGQRPDWYARRAWYGSTINWVGIHAFDYARWVSGRDYVTVEAKHTNCCHSERIGCQDIATVQTGLDNGGLALFSIDYLRPDGATSHGDDRLRIAGQRGVVEVVDRGTRLHVIDRDRDVPDWPLVHPERTLFSDFMAALTGQGELLAPAEDAFAVTRFAILATESADTGRQVKVPSSSLQKE